MSGPVSFYASTILIYFAVDVLSVWSLNLQYGLTGIYNFSWIMFQAVGAYTAGILTLGPSTGNGGFQHYIFGMTLPFPLPMLIAGAVAGLLSLPVGFIALRRLRADYQAMVMLVISVIGTLVAENVGGLFNGTAGLSLIPQPLASSLKLSSIGYQWFYVLISAVVCGIVYVFVHRVTSSPLGRALRSVRDNEAAAESLGKHVTKLRMFAFVFGNVIAGLSGALLVQFIGAWSPGSWMYVETLVILTAIIVGGTGNNFGVMFGALLVPIAFNEATRFIPTSVGPADLIAALQWVVIGFLALIFLWFWPRGLIPERRRRFAVPGRYSSLLTVAPTPGSGSAAASTAGTPPVALAAEEDRA